MNRAAWYVAVLLAILAAIIGSHLHLINISSQECDAYQRILLDRLGNSKIGSAEAIAIRK